MIYLVAGMHIFSCNEIYAQESTILEDLLGDSYQESINLDIEHNWASLLYIRENPIDINSAERNELGDLVFLSSYQIENILRYRRIHKGIQNKYELLAIPGISQHDARILSYFVRFGSLSILKPSPKTIRERFKEGKNEIIFRTRYSFGEEINIDTQAFAPNGYAAYLYRSPNKMQYGVVLENDKGENIIHDSKFKGVDFYSMHFYIENLNRRISVLALGDYKINMGQGLIMKAGFRNGKSTIVNNVASVGRTIKPFKSVNEFDFLRGIATKINLSENVNVALFGSFRKLDATLKYDSIQQHDYVSSLRKSGLHRTASEKDGKKVLNFSMLGSVINFQRKSSMVSLNILSSFSGNKILTNRFHNKKYIKNKIFSSLSYSTTFNSIHLFGESAIDNKKHGALIHGIIWSPDKNFDLSILSRKIFPGFHSTWSNAFSSGTAGKDELGIYIGAEVRKEPSLSLKGYYDVWRNEFTIKERDLPTRGNASFLRLTYNRRKHYQIYIQYRSISKRIVDLNTKRIGLKMVNQTNFRLHGSYHVSTSLEWRSRMEWTRVIHSDISSTGMLWYHDILYKPMMKGLSLTGRWAIFETDGYPARIYAYENDLLNVFRIPFYSGTGTKWYINLRYKFYKNHLLEIRYAHSVIANEKLKSEIGFQLKFKW